MGVHRQPASDRAARKDMLLLIINGHHEPVQFAPPECAGGTQWALLIDTNTPDEDEQKLFRHR